MLILPKERLMTESDARSREVLRESSLGEYVGASLAQGWDFSTPRVVLDELTVRSREFEEYDIREDPVFHSHKRELERHHITEEEWRASENYREGIEWEPMTPVRAQYLAEAFDARRTRDKVLAKPPGIGAQVLGFGAQFAASVPDPVNFIPFLGQGVRLRMMAKLGSIGGRMAASGIEAGIGTAVVNPLVYADLSKRGEKLTVADYALDTFLGAGVGALFGAGAGGWAKFRGETKADILRGLAKATLDVDEGRTADAGDALRQAWDSGRMTPQRVQRRLVKDMGWDDADAGRFVGGFDDAARKWSDEKGVDPALWWEAHVAEVTRGGEGAPGVRFAAMKKSPAGNVAEFVRAVWNAPQDSNWFYAGSQVSTDSVRLLADTLGINAKGVKLSIPADVVNHVHKRHPKMTLKEWEKLSGVVDSAEDVVLGNPKRASYGGTPLIFMKTEGEHAYGVAVEFSETRKRGRVFFLKTFFRDSKEKVGRWLEAERKKGRMGAGGSPALSPESKTPTSQTWPSSKSITPEYSEHNSFTPDDIRAAVEPLQSRAANALPIEVVGTAGELPPHVQRAFQTRGMQGAPGAVWDPYSSKVFFVADGVRDASHAVELWRHEQGLHHGLRGMFGERFGADASKQLDAALDEVFGTLGRERLDGLGVLYGLDMDNVQHRRLAAEEGLANIAEKLESGAELGGAERGAWESFKQWLRKVARDLGLREFDDSDALALVRDAMRWTMEGRSVKAGPDAVHPRLALLEDGPRANGAVEFLEDGRAFVRLFEGADPEAAARGLVRLIEERHPGGRDYVAPDFRSGEEALWESPREDAPPPDDIKTAHLDDDVAMLREEGRLTEMDEAELAASERNTSRALRWRDGVSTALNCIRRH